MAISALITLTLPHHKYVRTIKVYVVKEVYVEFVVICKCNKCTKSDHYIHFIYFFININMNLCTFLVIKQLLIHTFTNVNRKD